MQADVNQELAREFGLTASEYSKILEILRRTPTLTELGVFSVMWSEHCSYKSSRVFLKQLPSSAPWVIHGPGENAGVVDIGNGLAAVFKIENHNHPVSSSHIKAPLPASAASCATYSPWARGRWPT